jgi:hypothetical protein
MKAEQAEEAAKRAASDAEIARQKAKTYSPGASQPGKLHLATVGWLKGYEVTV